MPYTDPICFGPYRLSAIEHQVWKDDASIRLRPKTFDLLRQLVARAPDVVLRSELFEAVWGDVRVSANTLDATVRELRRALGDRCDGPVDVIETVYGKGYRLGLLTAPEISASAWRPLGSSQG